MKIAAEGTVKRPPRSCQMRLERVEGLEVKMP